MLSDPSREKVGVTRCVSMHFGSSKFAGSAAFLCCHGTTLHIWRCEHWIEKIPDLPPCSIRMTLLSSRFELRRVIRIEQGVTRHGSIHSGIQECVPIGLESDTFLSCQGNQIFGMWPIYPSIAREFYAELENRGQITV